VADPLIPFQPPPAIEAVVSFLETDKSGRKSRSKFILLDSGSSYGLGDDGSVSQCVTLAVQFSTVLVANVAESCVKISFCLTFIFAASLNLLRKA